MSVITGDLLYFDVEDKQPVKQFRLSIEMTLTEAGIGELLSAVIKQAEPQKRPKVDPVVTHLAITPL